MRLKQTFFIAYPARRHDHGYVQRLGQSPDCELRGLAGGAGPGSSTCTGGMGALGASILALRRLLPTPVCPAPAAAPGSIGRCRDVQVF
jgi:hypothetical protein